MNKNYILKFLVDILISAGIRNYTLLKGFIFLPKGSLSVLKPQVDFLFDWNPWATLVDWDPKELGKL